MVLALVAVVFLVLSAFAASTTQLLGPAQQNRLSALERGQAHIFEQAQRYHLQTGLWPTSLAQLANEPGFFDLKAYLPHSAGGALHVAQSPWSIHRSNTYAIAGLRDQRMAVLARHNSRETEASLLSASNNQCEGVVSADFASAVRWCSASPDAYTLQATTLQWVHQREMLALKQHAALADKFMRYRRATGVMPAAATATNLRTVVSAAQPGSTVGSDPATCQGTFHWSGLALECADLYNVFRNPIRYRRIDANQFELSSQSQVLDASGAPRMLTVVYTVL